MAGVAAAHFLRHIAPVARPEAGQVARGLDRAASGRGERQDERDARAAHGRVLGQAVERLYPQFDARAAIGHIVDRMAAACRGAEIGRGQPVHLLLAVPADQAVQHPRQVRPVDVRQAALARQQRREPFVQAGDQGGIGQRLHPGKVGAHPQRLRGLRPGKQIEAPLSHAVQQRRHHRRRIGPVVGA